MSLPDLSFLLIGAPRAATTWINRSLDDHPALFMPERELNYWNANSDYGEGWYSEQFAAAAADALLGENSSLYLADPGMPERVAELYPDARLLVTLRDPLERAVSHFRMQLANGLYPEGTSFAHAVRHPANALADPLAIGAYHANLERWRGRFSDDRIHIVLFEDIRAHPEEVVAGLYRFLGVADDWQPSTLGERLAAVDRAAGRPQLARGLRRAGRLGRKVAGKHWSRVRGAVRKTGLEGALRSAERRGGGEVLDIEVDEATRALFHERLDDDVRRLAELLGRDLSAWQE